MGLEEIGFVRYGRPYPPAIDHLPLNSGELSVDACLDLINSYVCTRSLDHRGRHEAAGTAREVFASWPREAQQEQP